MAMLVVSDTWPASTGFLSCADVNVRTKSFFAGFHCPDSLSSVTTTSLTFCVRIGFMSAAGADWTPAVIRAPTATITSKAFAMSSSLLKALRSEEHTSELQSRFDLVCRLLLEKKTEKNTTALK